MKREEVFAFTENCINGEPATCIAACPFHLDIKAFLKKAGKGRIGAAAQELNKSLPFPVMISELCPHPCENACQRHTVLGEETIAISLLEKTCANSPENKERKTFRMEPLPQRVAVVGAGPVGLAVALHMSRKRFPVEVFDREDGWGGSLRKHERFDAFVREWSEKFESATVTFHFGSEVTGLSQLDEFDLVFLATGVDGEDFGLRNSWDRNLGTTALSKVFLGGEMTGISLIEGLAQSVDIAKAMESWLQTGNPVHAAVTWEKTGCSHNVPHPDEPHTEHIVPSGKLCLNGDVSGESAEKDGEADGLLYTKEEAAAEASRCMQCDCEECVRNCELLTKFKKKPPRIAIDVAQDGMTRNSVSTACITRQTWSCNQCGHCAQICEGDVDIGGLFEISRMDRVERGLYPPAFHGYWLKEMQTATSESGLLRPAPAASESGLLRPAPAASENSLQCTASGTAETQYLFFPGCRLGGVNPDYVIRSYEALLTLHAETGIWLGCCGVPALWAGEGEAFAAHVDQMREAWEQLGSPAVIYACASCRRTFARFHPEVPLISLYELLEKGMRDGALRTEVEEHGEVLHAEAGAEYEKALLSETGPRCNGEVGYAVFDPCAAYGMGEVKQAVRSLAKMSGGRLTDYASNGKCCGFGGHIQLANPGFYDEVANARCGETDAPFLTYCVNCKEVFAAHGKKARHILDLVFGLASGEDMSSQEDLASGEGLDSEAGMDAPEGIDRATTLEEKRENNLRVKQAVLERWWKESFEPDRQPWESLPVEVPEQVRTDMERLLIPLNDVRQTIWVNEEAGEGFENQDGEVLCRMVGDYITCWVKYRPENGTYHLLEVYSHRMRIREDE